MKTEEIVKKIREVGGRMTRVKLGLVEVVRNAERPLSVKEITLKLEERGVVTSRTTVYREVDFLVRNGLIVEVNLYPGEMYYELAGLAHHHHMVCEGCGRVERVDECGLMRAELELFKRTGFKVSRHFLGFYGLCVKCNQEQNLLV